VTRNLDEIENWEQKVSRGLLNSRALESTAQLQRGIAEDMQRRDLFERVRQDDIARIAAVTASVAEWMAQQLEATKVSLEAGGVLTVGVSADGRGRDAPSSN
jgi:hypothetical protein